MIYRSKGATVRIDKEHDEHNDTLGVIQSYFTHLESKRVIYRVSVSKNGVPELRCFNEEYLKSPQKSL